MREESSGGLLVSEYEIAELRQSIMLLHAQAQSGEINSGFLLRQLARGGDLLERLERERRQIKQQTRYEALFNLSRLLGTSLDLQVVLDQVMDAILQLTGAERGFLMLRDDDGLAVVKAARNFDQRTLGSDEQRFSRSILYQVLDTGSPIVTTNAAEDPRFSAYESVVNQALRSIMAVPLRAHGLIIGVVYVDHPFLTNRFDADDLQALEALAGQAAAAIANARLFAATDHRLAAHLEEVRQLRRIDLQLSETLDANKTMHYTLEWACRLTGAEVGHLGLAQGDRVVVQQHYGIQTDETQPIYLDRSFPAVKTVQESGRTQHMKGDPFSTLIVPMRRDQRVIGVIVLRRRGEFSAEQQDLSERLAARAATAIENAQLYAAVQDANAAKNEFVGIVAHDLKVPMTSILGYTDLILMEDDLAPHILTYVNRIRDTIKRMELLVSDLADISRIESGQFYIDPGRVSVIELVQSVREAIATQIVARGHTWIEEIAPNLPEIYGDFYRLLQVLINLISNAYKYTPNGGTIKLRARSVEVDGRPRVEFSISDTGIGLSPAALQKLGTKFWRADDEFTRSQPGAGLGFAITRSLLEQMGSAIDIVSELGKGSTFTFTLPVMLAKDELPAKGMV
ncbi:MAG: GAF domain-containing protein [Aggregatilineales bacterium]